MRILQWAECNSYPWNRCTCELAVRVRHQCSPEILKCCNVLANMGAITSNLKIMTVFCTVRKFVQSCRSCHTKHNRGNKRKLDKHKYKKCMSAYCILQKKTKAKPAFRYFPNVYGYGIRNGSVRNPSS